MTYNKNPQKIQQMFDNLAFNYDKMNNFISLGLHLFVKFFALKELEIQPRTNLLDLCCGTGDFTKLILKFYPRAKVIGLDFSKEMLKLAKQKNPKNVFMLADVTDLPFKDCEFDYITISFGLRNIENRTKALYEIHRTLVNDGKFLHLDFGKHNNFSKIFNIIVFIMAKIFGKNFDSYNYLVESKEDFPPPEKLIQEISSCGFKLIKRQDFLFGIISSQVFVKS
jgi:demethylmenaquinone methyltransferase/2-methoxy-6-polyprenyl-1,4-benzoquinol methylase